VYHLSTTLGRIVVSLQYVIQRRDDPAWYWLTGDRWITDPVYARPFDYIEDAEQAGQAPDFPVPIDAWRVVGIEFPEPVERS
jgi:hypothetical protein